METIDTREAEGIMAGVADTLEGLGYVLGLVYDDMQSGADMRSIASLVLITRDLLESCAEKLDEADAGLCGIV